MLCTKTGKLDWISNVGVLKSAQKTHPLLCLIIPTPGKILESLIDLYPKGKLIPNKMLQMLRAQTRKTIMSRQWRYKVRTGNPFVTIPHNPDTWQNTQSVIDPYPSGKLIPNKMLEMLRAQARKTIMNR